MCGLLVASGLHAWHSKPLPYCPLQASALLSTPSVCSIVHSKRLLYCPSVCFPCHVFLVSFAVCAHVPTFVAAHLFLAVALSYLNHASPCACSLHINTKNELPTPHTLPPAYSPLPVQHRCIGLFRYNKLRALRPNAMQQSGTGRCDRSRNEAPTETAQVVFMCLSYPVTQTASSCPAAAASPAAQCKPWPGSRWQLPRWLAGWSPRWLAGLQPLCSRSAVVLGRFTAAWRWWKRTGPPARSGKLGTFNQALRKHPGQYDCGSGGQARCWGDQQCKAGRGAHSSASARRSGVCAPRHTGTEQGMLFNRGEGPSAHLPGRRQRRWPRCPPTPAGTCAARVPWQLA